MRRAEENRAKAVLCPLTRAEKIELGLGGRARRLCVWSPPNAQELDGCLHCSLLCVLQVGTKHERTSQDVEVITAMQQYIPATVQAPFYHEKSAIPFAPQQTPDHICGLARRVGWVTDATQPQPIYRLKLRLGLKSLKTSTLEGFFVLEQGVFVPYEPSHTSPAPPEVRRKRRKR